MKDEFSIAEDSAQNPSRKQSKKDYSELEKQIDERTHELSLLYELSRSMNGSQSLEEFVRFLLESASQISGCDLSLIFLSFEDRTELYFYLSSAVEEKILEEIARSIALQFQELSGREIRNEKRFLLRSRDYIPECLAKGPMEIVHQIPLFRKNLPIGVMAICSSHRKSIHESKVRLLYTISNQASGTLDRFLSSREAEQSRFRSILDSLTEGVVLTDLTSRLLMTNPAADAIISKLKLSRDQRFAESLGEKEVVHSIAEIRKGKTRSTSHEIAFPHHQTVLSVTASAMLDAREKITGIVWLLSDISRQRQLQEQMMQAEKLSALGEMISGIAHELNNPLTSVMGYAQLLQSASASKDLRKKLEVINSESKRCQRIVQNLLTFARKHKFEKKWFDLDGAIESVLQLLSYQFRVHNVEVEKNYSQGLPGVMGDVHQIQQVLLNILNNALQALLEVKRKRKITIRTEILKGGILIEIKDNGPGISETNIKKVFDPFFTTKEPGKGTGLGLSLARTAIRDHGGDIEVSSRWGEGTAFLVTWPTNAEAKSGEHEKKIPVREGKRLPGKRILVVDDEREIINVIEEALQSDGHRIHFASDGRMAIQELQAAEYDLIISDYKMPNMDGKELFARVSRKFPRLKERFIFMTGDTANPQTSDFFEKKKVKFLVKPFDVDDIKKLVRETL